MADWRIYDTAAKRKYTTKDEIEFLKALPSSGHGVPRLEMLRRYRQTMTRRCRWGLIDPDVIRTYLILEIGEEDNKS